ncbi:MAG: ABC transporter ATP-binding protein [Actinobacteria bacterium]|nr:ABC transporter ATP-binding protein [Actinomycetota bacterium]
MRGGALEIRVGDRLREFELELDARVEPGECTALVGPSGAGKTTVLRLVAGLRDPPRGRIAVGERVLCDTDAGICLEPEERRCGFLFQDHALFGHLSAWRNVAFGIGAPRSERRGRALALLGRFGIEGLADARPAELSGGERQRVALARALATAPDVLLLDEPLSALDARTRAHATRELAAALRDAAVPSLLVTHDFEEAAVLAAEICVMDRGRVVQRGSAAELSASPASGFVADFAGAAVLAGEAHPEPGGSTRVALEGGGEVHSSDSERGPVAVSVYPWEVALEPADEPAHGSARNRLGAEVVSVTQVGTRVRVGLATPQPLAAEVTAESVAGLGLRPGVRVRAVWKATATRLAPAAGPAQPAPGSSPSPGGAER